VFDYAFVLGPGFVGPANLNTISGNFIGTDPTGSASAGNGAVLVIAGIGNVIGGTAPADRNVIFGDIFLGSNGAGGTIVQGNYIGLNAAGTAALPSSGSFSTILASNASSGGNIIGGSAPGAGNVIVGGTAGVNLQCPNNVVQGNFIGTNATGTAGLGGGIGIVHADGANNTIDGNLMSGVDTGIFENAGTANTVIRGNKIGSDVTGMAAIGNAHSGVVVHPGPFCTIGGPNAATGT
jgi:titin